MKNLLTSLKKLGKKMTGSDVTGSDLVTVVDNIADGYTGSGGGGGGDKGYEVATTELFSESITTVDQGGTNYAPLSYTGEPLDSIIVNFDGEEFTYSASSPVPGVNIYGASNPGAYSDSDPFTIICSTNVSPASWMIYTKDPGTHVVTVSGETIVVSNDFDTAVHSCVTEREVIKVALTDSMSGLRLSLPVSKIIAYIEQNYSVEVWYNDVIVYRLTWFNASSNEVRFMGAYFGQNSENSREELYIRELVASVGANGDTITLNYMTLWNSPSQ